MSMPLIKCPMCKNSRLVITEALQVHYSTIYDNGEFVGVTNEHPHHTISQSAQCKNESCKHEWTFSEEIDLSDIPSRKPEGELIEFKCIGCNKERKLRKSLLSNFNPKLHVCSQCEIGISDIY